MPEEFEIEKLKSDYPEFFRQASPEFVDFMFSEKTSSEIAEICRENGVRDEGQVEKIAYRVTLALLDHISKENLAEIIELGVGLDPETSKKIALGLNSRILSKAPEMIKKTEAPTPPIPPAPTTPRKAPPPKKAQPEAKTGEIKEIKKDIYREPVE